MEVEEEKEEEVRRTRIGENKNEEEEEEEEGRQHKKRRKVEENTAEERGEEMKMRGKEEKKENDKVEEEEEEEDNTSRMKEEEGNRREEKEKKREEKKEEEVSTLTMKENDKEKDRGERKQEENEKMEEEEEEDKSRTQAQKQMGQEIGTNGKTENTNGMEVNRREKQTLTVYMSGLQTAADQTQTNTQTQMPTPPPLSKRQLKKQLKRAQWLETKDERRKLKRQREKQKAKERKLRQAQQTLENTSQPSLTSPNEHGQQWSQMQTVGNSGQLSVASLTPSANIYKQQWTQHQTLGNLTQPSLTFGPLLPPSKVQILQCKQPNGDCATQNQNLEEPNHISVASLASLTPSGNECKQTNQIQQSSSQTLEKAIQPSLAPINPPSAPLVALKTQNQMPESSHKSNLAPTHSPSARQQNQAPDPSHIPIITPSTAPISHCKETTPSTQTLKQPSQPRVTPSVSCVTPVSRRSLKKHSVRMSASPCKLRVAVDLSLEGLMDDRRLGQCLRQVARCYSANRRVPAPLQLFVTSFCGRPKSVMSLQAGYTNWDVNFCANSYIDEFQHSDIVYLTSESSDTLEKLDHTKVYIIGGLVDHNKLKGHCLKLASNLKLSTARLPIERYLDMTTRKVLTIDQVFRILLGVAGGNRWRDVLLSVLPARKGAKGKEEEEEDLRKEVEENDDNVKNEETLKREEKEEEAEEEKEEEKNEEC